MELYDELQRVGKETELLRGRVSAEETTLKRELLIKSLEVLNVEDHIKLDINVSITSNKCSVDFDSKRTIKEEREFTSHYDRMYLGARSPMSYNPFDNIILPCLGSTSHSKFTLWYEGGEISITNKSKMKKKEYADLIKKAESIFSVVA